MDDLDRSKPSSSAHPHYAADRWAAAVMKVMTADEDPTTIERWGRIAGASNGSLTTWCRAAHVSPRRSGLAGSRAPATGTARHCRSTR